MCLNVQSWQRLSLWFFSYHGEKKNHVGFSWVWSIYKSETKEFILFFIGVLSVSGFIYLFDWDFFFFIKSFYIFYILKVLTYHTTLCKCYYNVDILFVVRLLLHEVLVYWQPYLLIFFLSNVFGNVLNLIFPSLSLFYTFYFSINFFLR